MEILVVCTANICRSPMGEALLRRHVELRGVDATVSSAGLLTGGRTVSDGSRDALTAYGIGIDDHVSTQMTVEALGRTDLVLAMERRHVREAVVLAPEIAGRALTIRALVDRGEAVGPRGERPFDEWLSDVVAGVDGGMGSSDLDVVDPYGGPQSGYVRTAAELVELTDAAADLLWGPLPAGAAPLLVPEAADDGSGSWWSRVVRRTR